MIPTQWIETDQNDHLKRPAQEHVAEFKSRLVACGNFEDTEGVRADRHVMSRVSTYVSVLQHVTSYESIQQMYETHIFMQNQLTG
eukprot:10793340-Karenia_brevis.AAC.1